MGGGNLSDRVSLEVIKLDLIRRNSYGTAKEFIIAYQKQREIFQKRNVAPPPFYSLHTILAQLKGELSKIAFIKDRYGEKVPDSFNLEDFNNICKQLQVESDEQEVGAANAAEADQRSNRKKKKDAADKSDKSDNNKSDSKPQNQTPRSSDNKKASTNNDKASSKKQLRGAPPEGKDIAEWAKENREAEEQLDDNGNCSFCGTGPHNARKCFHLASSVSYGWKFNPTVWAFSEAKKKAEGSCCMAISASASSSNDGRWLLDSGAQQTITGCFEDFYTYEPLDSTVAYAYRSVSG